MKYRAAQVAEAPARDAANLRWLERAFATATKQHARSVVIIEQADMWDTDGKSIEHLSNYEQYVSSIAHPDACVRQAGVDVQR